MRTAVRRLSAPSPAVQTTYMRRINRSYGLLNSASLRASRDACHVGPISRRGRRNAGLLTDPRPTPSYGPALSSASLSSHSRLNGFAALSSSAVAGVALEPKMYVCSRIVLGPGADPLDRAADVCSASGHHELPDACHVADHDRGEHCVVEEEGGRGLCRG